MDLQPVTNCELVGRSDHQRILSSGFSCPVGEPEVCNDSEFHKKEIPSDTSQPLPMGSINPSLLRYSPPTACHRHLLRGYFECIQLKSVIRSSIHSYIYLSFCCLLAIESHSFVTCMLQTFYLSLQIQCNKMTYG